jgi:hypothetical protein
MRSLRTNKIVEIFHHLKDENQMHPKLLPVKHFENVLFHSLSPYDFQLRVERDTIVKMIEDLNSNADDIALMKPPKNDQLFQFFMDNDETGVK